MNLTKAIEILKQSYRPQNSSQDYDFNNALMLGIEALKFLRTLRSMNLGSPHKPLPGETEDAEPKIPDHRMNSPESIKRGDQ